VRIKNLVPTLSTMSINNTIKKSINLKKSEKELKKEKEIKIKKRSYSKSEQLLLNGTKHQ